jgi:hypothetical protein
LRVFGGSTTPILSHFGIIEKSFGGFEEIEEYSCFFYT